ncbi:8779_t:CDS:2, partial [Entrophospora sp. SA101]
MTQTVTYAVTPEEGQVVPYAVITVAKSCYAKKNNDNIKFLKGHGINYLAQNCSRFNGDTLKETFILHVAIPKLTSQQIKEPDYFQYISKNAANKINLPTLVPLRHCTHNHTDNIKN